MYVTLYVKKKKNSLQIQKNCHLRELPDAALVVSMSLRGLGSALRAAYALRDGHYDAKRSTLFLSMELLLCLWSYARWWLRHLLRGELCSVGARTGGASGSGGSGSGGSICSSDTTTTCSLAPRAAADASRSSSVPRSVPNSVPSSVLSSSSLQHSPSVPPSSAPCSLTPPVVIYCGHGYVPGERRRWDGSSLRVGIGGAEQCVIR